MANISNLFIDQGSDYSVSITVEDLNLTGYDVNSQFRKSYGSSTAYDFTGSILSASDSQSVVRLILLGETSKEISSGRYVYDVEVVSPGGSTKRIVEGVVTISPRATQSEL